MSDSTMTPNQLPALGFLAGLSEEHRSFLAVYGRYLRPEEGDTIITEGAPQESLYVLLAGKLHIVAGQATDRPMFLGSLEVGDSMGEINLFDPGVASATAVARSKALLWALSREELESFLEADPVVGLAVLRALLGQMSKRFRGMIDKLATAKEKSSLHEFWSNSSP